MDSEQLKSIAPLILEDNRIHNILDKLMDSCITAFNNVDDFDEACEEWTAGQKKRFLIRQGCAADAIEKECAPVRSCIECDTCGESWDSDTMGYKESLEVMQRTGDQFCLSCEDPEEEINKAFHESTSYKFEIAIEGHTWGSRHTYDSFDKASDAGHEAADMFEGETKVIIVPTA